VGDFAIRPGGLMAASDEFTIEVLGSGGHAAMPHQTVDPVLAASQIVVALQSIAARNVDPLASAVVSVTCFRTESDAFNVIPERVDLRGTARSLDPAVQDLIEARMETVVGNTARAFGAEARLTYRRGYPVTINSAAEAAFAARVAGAVVGEARVDPQVAPVMGAEDFSYKLNARPGAIIFVGNGDTARLHHPKYDFNDDLIPVGCSYWAKLVETAMPVS
jgi:hippurate hydrolase